MHNKYVHTVLKPIIDRGFIESVTEISPACLISCFVKSLTRKFPMKIHWSPQKLVFTAPLKLCRIRSLVQGHLNSVMLAGKGAKAGAFYGCWNRGSLLTAPPWCSKLTYKGKATRWKIIPAPTANRGRASVAGMYPSPLCSSRQVWSHLSCCCFLCIRPGREIQMGSQMPPRYCY